MSCAAALQARPQALVFCTGLSDRPLAAPKVWSRLLRCIDSRSFVRRVHRPSQ